MATSINYVAIEKKNSSLKKKEINKQGWQHPLVAKLFSIIRKMVKKKKIINWLKMTKPFATFLKSLSNVANQQTDGWNIYRINDYWLD